jgi:hypothetical protein
MHRNGSLLALGRTAGKGTSEIKEIILDGLEAFECKGG